MTLRNNAYHVLTHSPEETLRLGQKIGRLLKAGDVLALVGELGSGKTTLVKGIAKGLSVNPRDEVLSPTYVLIHEYEGREKVYHIDWYRLESVEGVDASLAQQCFDSKAVTLVEWADRAGRLLPKEHIRIELKHEHLRSRHIQVKAVGKSYSGFMAAVRKNR